MLAPKSWHHQAVKSGSILSLEEERRADEWVSQLGSEATRRAGGKGVGEQCRQANGKIGLSALNRSGRCKTVGLYTLFL
jgi:hypothetical protein